MPENITQNGAQFLKKKIAVLNLGEKVVVKINKHCNTGINESGIVAFGNGVLHNLRDGGNSEIYCVYIPKKIINPDSVGKPFFDSLKHVSENNQTAIAFNSGNNTVKFFGYDADSIFNSVKAVKKAK